MALGDKVTFESQWAGMGFEDLKSLAVTNLLRAMMIQEEQSILFGQNSSAAASQQAPGAVGAAPNLATPTTATTGGALPATTAYYFKQTVITGMGESLPSASPATVTTGAGTTNSITVTPVAPAGQPVLGYRLYMSTSSGGTYYLVAAANVATAFSSATLNGLSWITNGQALVVTSAASSGANPPASDASANSLAYNGLLAQMFGGSGATLTALNGTLTSAAIGTLLQNLWNAARADPDGIWCNAQESVKLTNITLGAGTPYFVMPGEPNNATAGFRVSRFTNAVTGSELPINVHPYLPQGTLLALSSKLPSWYVPSNIGSVWALDLPQDYIEIDYPPTQASPFWQMEVRLYGTLKLYLPLIQGALTGINNQ
jgi:hypothetical protein